MTCDAIKQVLIEVHAECRVVFAHDINRWLKPLQRLEGAFETDRARLDIMLGCRLGHDRSEEIVSEDVCPELFANKLRRLASQDIHLHYGFQ